MMFWRLTKEFIRRPSWWFFGWLAETGIVDRIIQDEIIRDLPVVEETPETPEDLGFVRDGNRWTWPGQPGEGGER